MKTNQNPKISKRTTLFTLELIHCSEISWWVISKLHWQNELQKHKSYKNNMKGKTAINQVYLVKADHC